MMRRRRAQIQIQELQAADSREARITVCRRETRLTAVSYTHLDEDCKWVEETIAGMTTEEKIGQLFFNMGSSRDEEYLKMTVDKYHIGGIRYNPATGAEVREQNRILQENSKIPLIIACNTENGGNGACTDGTMIGQQTKIGATRAVSYTHLKEAVIWRYRSGSGASRLRRLLTS